MFTGLVEDLGTVVRADRRSDALVLAVRPAKIPLTELAIGESVCHDGACLTVTEVGRDAFTVLAGAETLARTTLGGLRVGSRVNLERSLRMATGSAATGSPDTSTAPASSPFAATSVRTSCSASARHRRC